MLVMRAVRRSRDNEQAHRQVIVAALPALFAPINAVSSFAQNTTTVKHMAVRRDQASMQLCQKRFHGVRPASALKLVTGDVDFASSDAPL